MFCLGLGWNLRALRVVCLRTWMESSSSFASDLDGISRSFAGADRRPRSCVGRSRLSLRWRGCARVLGYDAMFALFTSHRGARCLRPRLVRPGAWRAVVGAPGDDDADPLGLAVAKEDLVTDLHVLGTVREAECDARPLAGADELRRVRRSSSHPEASPSRCAIRGMRAVCRTAPMCTTGMYLRSAQVRRVGWVGLGRRGPPRRAPCRRSCHAPAPMVVW